MIEIPLNPITKKNHQQIVTNGKRPFIIQSKAYREYEKNAMYFIRPLGIDYPVNVKCLFYMKTHRRVDLVNLLEAIDDILDGNIVMVDMEKTRLSCFVTTFMTKAKDAGRKCHSLILYRVLET